MHATNQKELSWEVAGSGWCDEDRARENGPVPGPYKKGLKGEGRVSLSVNADLELGRKKTRQWMGTRAQDLSSLQGDSLVLPSCQTPRRRKGLHFNIGRGRFRPIPQERHLRGGDGVLVQDKLGIGKCPGFGSDRPTCFVTLAL